MNVSSYTELGQWFVEDHAYTPDPLVLDAVYDFLDHHLVLIPYDVRCVNFQPYTSCKQMIRDVQESGTLLISSIGNGGPLGESYNLIFRAVHDTHHIELRAPFSFEGECRASAYMLSHVDMWASSQLAMEIKRLLFSEMAGQISRYYYRNREYLRDQFACHYPDATIESFQEYWTHN